MRKVCREMDKRIIDGFIYLSKKAKIPVWEQEELLDIICEHEFRLFSGHGRQWERCVYCDRLRNIVDIGVSNDCIDNKNKVV